VRLEQWRGALLPAAFAAGRSAVVLEELGAATG